MKLIFKIRRYDDTRIYYIFKRAPVELIKCFIKDTKIRRYHDTVPTMHPHDPTVLHRRAGWSPDISAQWKQEKVCWFKRDLILQEGVPNWPIDIANECIGCNRCRY